MRPRTARCQTNGFTRQVWGEGSKNQHNFDVRKKHSFTVFLDPCTAGIQLRTTVLFLNYQVHFSPLMKCFSSLIIGIIPFVNSQSKRKILYFTSQFFPPSSVVALVFICVPQSAKGSSTFFFPSAFMILLQRQFVVKVFVLAFCP